MMAPLAPVEAGLALGTTRMGEALRRYLQGLGQETLTLRGQLDVVLALSQQLLFFHAVEHLHAEIASEMIIADPRAAQRRILRPGAHAQMAGTRGKPLKALQHTGDIGVGEAKVAVAALLFLLDQVTCLQFRQMRAGGLRRDAGLVRELACSQRAAGHQRRQHIGAGGIADQCCDHGDIGACFHSSTITEASTSIKQLLSIPKDWLPNTKHRRLPWLSPFLSATGSIRSSARCSSNTPGAGSPSFRRRAAI